MVKKKYTKSQVRKMESELFSTRTTDKRMKELRKTLREYGWN